MRRFVALILAYVLIVTPALLPGLARATEDLGNEEGTPSNVVDSNEQDLGQDQETDGTQNDSQDSQNEEDADTPEIGQEIIDDDNNDDVDDGEQKEHDEEALVDEDKESTLASSDALLEEEDESSADKKSSDEDGLSAEAVKVPTVEYSAHVQNIGWQKSVKNGKVAGTSGKSLRVEALRIWLRDIGKNDGGLGYRMHVQNKGWLGWVKDGALGGTTGKSLRTEAFQLRLYGKAADLYDVWYRVHVQNIGWMAWAKNGQLCGSEGRSLRLEAIQIRVVERGTTPEDLESSNVSYAFSSAGESSSSSGDISIRAHVQNKGWRAAVGGGATAGSTGSSLRLEAFKIDSSNPAIANGLEYRAHVQNVGWQDWRSVGGVAGTTGKSLRVEAIQIQLNGDAAEQYDVYYRAHVQNIGWMAWAKNGDMAGSIGLSYRCEAMQVRLVPKDQAIQLPTSAYRGALVNASAKRPPKLSVKLVPQLQHGYKPFAYQRCIVMHDTTEYRPFDYWIDAWIRRGGSGTHFMVKEDGSIRQYADLNQICWHASGATRRSLDVKYGVTEYKANAGSAMNQCSIGIEIDHVIDGRGYPQAQLDAIDALIAYIDEYYGFYSTILQHKDYHTQNGDCSAEFQGYLRNLQQHRTTR